MPQIRRWSDPLIMDPKQQLPELILGPNRPNPDPSEIGNRVAARMGPDGVSLRHPAPGVNASYASRDYQQGLRGMVQEYTKVFSGVCLAALLGSVSIQGKTFSFDQVSELALGVRFGDDIWLFEDIKKSFISILTPEDRREITAWGKEKISLTLNLQGKQLEIELSKSELLFLSDRSLFDRIRLNYINKFNEDLDQSAKDSIRQQLEQNRQRLRAEFSSKFPHIDLTRLTESIERRISASLLSTIDRKTIGRGPEHAIRIFGGSDPFTLRITTRVTDGARWFESRLQTFYYPTEGQLDVEAKPITSTAIQMYQKNDPKKDNRVSAAVYIVGLMALKSYTDPYFLGDNQRWLRRRLNNLVEEYITEQRSQSGQAQDFFKWLYEKKSEECNAYFVGIFTPGYEVKTSLSSQTSQGQQMQYVALLAESENGQERTVLFSKIGDNPLDAVFEDAKRKNPVGVRIDRLAYSEYAVKFIGMEVPINNDYLQRSPFFKVVVPTIEGFQQAPGSVQNRVGIFETAATITPDQINSNNIQNLKISNLIRDSNAAAVLDSIFDSAVKILRNEYETSGNPTRVNIGGQNLTLFELIGVPDEQVFSNSALLREWVGGQPLTRRVIINSEGAGLTSR